MSPNTTPSAPRVRAAVAFFLVTLGSVRKRPMSSATGRGHTVQMDTAPTTCGGAKTLLRPDDNPAVPWESGRMPSQAAISVDANAIDPIAALKRVGGVRHDTHMRR